MKTYKTYHTKVPHFAPLTWVKKNGAAPREHRDPKVSLGNLAKPDTFYPFSIYYFENSFISINLRRFLPRSLLKRRHFCVFEVKTRHFMIIWPFVTLCIL